MVPRPPNAQTRDDGKAEQQPPDLHGNGQAGNARQAPGGPGRGARGASGAKTGVGTALGSASPVWFTLSHGIVTEVYHPSVDTACTRDLQLLVADGHDFFVEEKRDTTSEVSYLTPGVPAFRLV